MDSDTSITKVIREHLEDLAFRPYDAHQARHPTLVKLVMERFKSRFTIVSFEQLLFGFQGNTTINKWTGYGGYTSIGGPSNCIKVEIEKGNIHIVVPRFEDYFFHPQFHGTYCGLKDPSLEPKDVILENVSFLEATKRPNVDCIYLQTRLHQAHETTEIKYKDGKRPTTRPEGYRLLYEAPEPDKSTKLENGDSFPFPIARGAESEHLLDFVVAWSYLEVFRDQVTQLVLDPTKVEVQNQYDDNLLSIWEQLKTDGFVAFLPNRDLVHVAQEWQAKLIDVYKRLTDISHARDIVPNEHGSQGVLLSVTEGSENQAGTILFQPRDFIPFGRRTPSSVLIHFKCVDVPYLDLPAQKVAKNLEPYIQHQADISGCENLFFAFGGLDGFV